MFVNEAILYLLYHKGYNAVKLGISDITGNRYKSHKSKGWELVAYWHFFERDQARAVETKVLQHLRMKHGYYLDKKDMPQAGYTETFDASKVKKKGLIRLVNRTILRGN